MAYTQNTGVSQKRKVFLRVWEWDEEDDRTHYYARAGRLEIEGWAYYMDRDDVKELVRRILKAERPLPDNVARAVDAVVSYLATGAVQLGLTTVAASAGYEGLTFTVEMFYDDNGGWTVEVRAVVILSNGRHIVSKRTTLKSVTVEALRKIIEKAVRQAYNSSP